MTENLKNNITKKPVVAFKITLNDSDLGSRVIKNPYFTSWDFPKEHGGGVDCICEEGEINYDGLNDHEKMILYIFAWNKSNICPSKKSVVGRFGWSSYKVAKMFKELKNYLKCVYLFSERTGLLAGRGYLYKSVAIIE
jgi:hypothetical protein